MKKVYIKMCVNKICKKLRCFLEKKYKADKNFTRPPVATVATNSKSGHPIGQLKLFLFQPKPLS